MTDEAKRPAQPKRDKRSSTKRPPAKIEAKDKKAEMRGEAPKKVDPVVEELKTQKPEPKAPRKPVVEAPKPEPVVEKNLVGDPPENPQVEEAPAPHSVVITSSTDPKNNPERTTMTKMGKMKARKRARG